jgi:acyl phosphate:glycerol-3-phosphate acyltransferase
MEIAVSLIAGYIFGSVSFAYLFTLFLTGEDIREIGTKNPGAANVARCIGKKWGVLVWLGDTIKGMVPLVFAQNMGITNTIVLTLIGLAAVVGHCYSVFLRFKGGKGAATTGGIVLFLMPLLFPLVILLWFIAQKINPRSAKVLLTCTVFYFICLFLGYGLRINIATFFQTAISTLMLIASSFFINPDLIKEMKSGWSRK